MALHVSMSQAKLSSLQHVSTARTSRPTLLQCRRIFKSAFCSHDQVPANKKRFVPTVGNYPRGFVVGSTYSGIKPASKSQPDLVLVASDRPSYGAGVFTKNEFAAPSVVFTKEILRETNGSLRGVIANSGCANLFNGEAGLTDTARMSREADKCFTSRSREPASTRQRSTMMVMHTGSGGQRLPIDNIVQSIPKICQSLGSSHEHWLEAARGIMTGDSFPKLVSRNFTLPSSPDTVHSVAGITKGAGMIHPNMATTLGIICTDARVSPVALQNFLSAAASETYNCISIEGDTSTNDMVAMFANGAASGPEIIHHGSSIPAPTDLPPQSKQQQLDDAIAFQQILTSFMVEMAQLVIRDAEGATKFITIRIINSPSYPAAKNMASVIARSILVKTESAGKGPDWGTVAIALGYSLIDTPFAGKGIIVPGLTSIGLAHEGKTVTFLHRGTPVPVDEHVAKHIMEQEDVEVVVDLRDDGMPRNVREAVYWTCDLTHEFVSMNSEL